MSVETRSQPDAGWLVVTRVLLCIHKMFNRCRLHLSYCVYDRLCIRVLLCIRCLIGAEYIESYCVYGRLCMRLLV